LLSDEQWARVAPVLPSSVVHGIGEATGESLIKVKDSLIADPGRTPEVTWAASA
jgi:hypothetical protein